MTFPTANSVEKIFFLLHFSEELSKKELEGRAFQTIPWQAFLPEKFARKVYHFAIPVY